MMNKIDINKILKFGAIYHLISGIFLVLVAIKFTSLFSPFSEGNSACFIGVYAILFSVCYFILSLESKPNWLMVLFLFCEKVILSLLGVILFLCYHFNFLVFIFFTLNSFLWIFPLYHVLNFIFTESNGDEINETTFFELLNKVKTNQGSSLLNLSENQAILLVFIRHLGCTFCRETVSEIAKSNEQLKSMGLTPVFVHLSDPDFGSQFFNEYYTQDVLHISDPSRKLFRSLNIKRGSLWQLYGLSTWWRGIIAGLIKGHGGVKSIEGDEMQLGAFFILKKGQIVFSHYNRNASEPFDLDLVILNSKKI